jgi:hypothetical protein
MGDRWVAGADKDPSFADLFTIGSLDRLFQPKEFNIGAVKEIAGVNAVGLMDFDDVEKRLFVASTGKPYPLQLTGKDGAELTFSDFVRPSPASRHRRRAESWTSTIWSAEADLGSAGSVHSACGKPAINDDTS